MALRRRFDLGRCLVTPAARAHLAAAGVAAAEILARHAGGDWGDLDREDRMENERAIVRGWRIFSQYLIAGEAVWVETSADRRETTVLLAGEH